MYESFYNFSANPFKLAPDSRFCFSHPCHDEARAYLEFAFKLGEGFVIFTGRPGTGKTTLVRSFLDSLEETQTIAARIAVSNLNAADLLRAVAYAYDLDVEGLDMASVLRRLERYFAQQVRSGKRILLIIDEAQGLSRGAMEELRMLADLQIDSRFLLQVFLVGQEKLRQLMTVPEMEQFQQRVTGTCKLMPLSLQETRDYMEYRLCRVDWSGDPELSGSAVNAVYRNSEGIPRHINKLCTRLLLHGLLENKHVLDEQDVREVAEGLKDEQLAPFPAGHAVVDAGKRVRQTKRCAEQDEHAYAALALRAPRESTQRAGKLERRASVERQAKRTELGESVAVTRHDKKVGVMHKTADMGFVGWGLARVRFLASYATRSVKPAAVLGVSIVLTLFLVSLVINTENPGETGKTRAMQEDSYETWVRLSRYRDGQYGDLTVYEEPDFVREYHEPRSAQVVTARQQLPADPAGEVKQASVKGAESSANEPEPMKPSPKRTEPVMVFDYAISELASIEGFRFSQAQTTGFDPEPVELMSELAASERQDDKVAVALTVALENGRDGEVVTAFQVRAEPAVMSDSATRHINDVVQTAEAKQLAAEMARQNEVRRLLVLARESLREYRLLIPEGNSAYGYYKQIDEIDPGNHEAAQGIREITEQYILLARRAIERDEETSASFYIRRGLRIAPQDGRLLALQAATQKSEIQRAEVAPAQPRQVSRKVETLLSKLNKIIEKDQSGIKKNSIWHDEDDVW